MFLNYLESPQKRFPKPDWDAHLSFIILEFYIWNPNWDKYLTEMMKQRFMRYEEKKRENNG